VIICLGKVLFCICPITDATAIHCLLLQQIQIGCTFLVPAHPGSAGHNPEEPYTIFRIRKMAVVIVVVFV